MLLSISFVQAAPSTPPKMFVDPDLVTGLAVGDIFTVDIKITGARNVYAWGFTLDFAPYLRTLAPISVSEGEFLHGGPYPWPYNTFFSKLVDNFGGKVHLGCTRIGDVPGQYGDGLLASIQFKVLNAGNSPLDLENTELLERVGTTLESMNHNTWNGFYDGPEVKIVMKEVLPGRKVSLGETLEFRSMIKNTGDIPLYTKVVFDMMRDDATPVQLAAGQSFSGTGPELFEYLYVNEYSAFLEGGWTNTPGGVIGTPDGSYAESGTNGAWTSEYGFEDIVLGDRLISRVDMEGYTRYPNGATDAVDIDMYCIQPYDYMFSWFGSLWGTDEWGWHGPRWVGPDETVDYIVPPCGTEAGLNDLTVLIYNYHGDSPDVIQVDSLRLKVTFSKLAPVSQPVYLIEPNDNLELDNAIWPTTEYDVGKYHCTAYAYYSYDGVWWVRADNDISFHFTVVE
jgi:hypothetical protein